MVRSVQLNLRAGMTGARYEPIADATASKRGVMRDDRSGHAAPLESLLTDRWN